MSPPENELDGVALGLRRSPRRWLLPALVTVALGVAFLATRPVPETEVASTTETPSVEAPAPVTPPPAKHSRVKRSTRAEPAPRTRLAVESPPPPKAAAAPPAPVAVEPTPPPPPTVEEAPAVVSAARLEEVDDAPPPAPPAETEERDGNGEAIARAIAAAKRQAVRECFEHELKQAPKLRGTVVVELELAPPARVLDVKVSDDLERPEFTRCVAATMRDVKFTALDEELSVRVPYVLTPGKK